MKINRIKSAFFLLAVFTAVQFADIFDSVPCTVESERQTISIRSNDLPFTLANSQTRHSSEVCCAYIKAFISPTFLELKRLHSIQVQTSFDRNIISIVERPSTALYERLLRILI